MNNRNVVKIRLGVSPEDIPSLKAEYSLLPEYSVLGPLYRMAVRRVERLVRDSENDGAAAGCVSFPWDCTAEGYLLALRMCQEHNSEFCAQIVGKHNTAPGHDSQLYYYEKDLELLK